MDRFIGLRLDVALALAVVICGWCDRESLAAGPGRAAPPSCTQQGDPCLQGGAGCVRHGACGGPRCGCGPSRCGYAACGRPACCPGMHGCGPCCHGACCPCPCDSCGHCLHHDVYEKRYFLRSQGKSWHSTWYDPAEGRPIALVVPPTAEFQSQYGWGVPSSRVAPIYHQFRRPYPGPGGVAGSGGGFLPTPNLPSDTVQFGVNAVRGPWGSY